MQELLPGTPVAGAPRNKAVATDLSLSEFFRILRRRQLWVVLTVLVVMALAASVVLSRKPVFIAEAVLVVDTASGRLIAPAGPANPLLDLAAVRSELDFLGSSRFVRHFIERAGLMADAEFRSQIASESRFLSFAQRMLSKGWGELEEAFPAKLRPVVERDLPQPKGEQPNSAVLEDPDMREAIEAVQRRLRLLNDGRSYTIRIQFEAQSATTAARLVNLLVESYLEEKTAAKMRTLERKAAWVSDMVEAQKLKVREADGRVQQFREKNQLADSKGSSVLGQQISELTTQLTLVRAERAQIEARSRQMAELPQTSQEGGARNDGLTSPFLQRLREQESDLLRREAELSTTYGPRHPRLINIRAEIQDIERKIESEIAKVSRAVANDANIIRRREAALAGELAGLRRQQDEKSRAEIALRELEREADQQRALLATYTGQETGANTAAALFRPDALLVSPAEPPSNDFQSRNGLILLVAFVASLFLAGATALIAERLDDRCCSVDQIEQELGFRAVGLVPEIGRRWLLKVRPHNYILDRPNSSYAEAVRSALTTTKVALRVEGAIIALVTSSMNGEGKTSFAASLARDAAREGNRVLLIEGIFHRANSAPTGKPKFLSSLFTDLDRPETTIAESLQEAVLVDPKTKLHVLVGQAWNDTGLPALGSPRLAGFLTNLRQSYDVIVIDAPPVLAHSDVTLLSTIADVTLFLIRWRKTTRSMAINALAQLSFNDQARIGIVLSRIDLLKHKALGYRDRAAQFASMRAYYND